MADLCYSLYHFENTDGAEKFMNLNEECLLQYLNNPERLDLSTQKLKEFIFFLNNDINRKTAQQELLNIR